MSCEEVVRNMNAALNTPATWEKRWQIERECNEQLQAAGQRLRTGLYSLQAASGVRYERRKSLDRGAMDAGSAASHDRMLSREAGYAAALHDVLELMEAAER